MHMERRIPLAALFTASSIEHHAAQAYIEHSWEETHPQGTIYTRGVFTTPHGSWNIAIVESGTSNTETTLEGERAIHHLQPDLLLFIGVAGGLQKVQAGDVVVATKIYAYESGRVGADAFEARPNMGRSTYRMEQRARMVARKNDWLQPLDSTRTTPVVHLGAVASGEKLLTSTNSSLWRLLQTHYNDALAIETAGYGMLSVAYANPQMEALAIHGISYLVDGINTAHYETIASKTAAHHASAFAFAMLNSLYEDEYFRGHTGTGSTFLPSLSQGLGHMLDTEQLHKALLDAFPTQDELQLFVAYKLRENLEAITQPGTLTFVIFDLIRWTRARGQLEQLLQAAFNARPNNPHLQTLAKQAGLDIPQHASHSYETVTQPPVIAEKQQVESHPMHIAEMHPPHEHEIDTGSIFIARDAHTHRFHALIDRWQSSDPSMPVSSIGEDPTPNNKLLGPVVTISGTGGLGKSALLQNCRLLASNITPLINVSNIIDWEMITTHNRILSPGLESQEIDPSEYFKVLGTRLAKALPRYEKDFKELEKAQKVLADAANIIEKSVKRMRSRDDYAFLHRLNRQNVQKVLQLASQPDYQALEQIKMLVGQNTGMRREHLEHFVEAIKQKLGNLFIQYLQPAQYLGRALGTDIRLIAEKDLLLIFFDTYEQALAGDAWLRIVMSAAGARVGWVIASRTNIWSYPPAIQGHGMLYEYEKIVQRDRACFLDLNAHEGGVFTLHDIAHYFELLRSQDPSLPEVNGEAASAILRATNGIPLVVRIVAELYAKERQLHFLQEASTQTEIVGRFVQYYFRHILRGGEEEQLYVLALLRRTYDRRALMARQRLIQDWGGDYEKSLQVLQHSHSFLFTSHTQPLFHQDIRQFLRSWLLNELPNQRIEKIINLLQENYHAQIHMLEERGSYRNVQERLEDDEWIEAYLDLAEIYTWLDIREGTLHNLLFLIAAASYIPEDQKIRSEVLQTGVFFRDRMRQPIQRWWDLSTQFLYPSANIYSIDDQTQGLQELLSLLTKGILHCASRLASHLLELEALLWWRLGKVYQQYDEQEALVWYKKALERLPEQQDLRAEIFTIHWIRASNAYQEERYQDCITFLEDALRDGCNIADAYYGQGNAYYALRNYPQAICHYQYATLYNSSHLYAHVNLGNTYFTQKNYRIAIQVYDQAIKLDDRDAASYYNRANAYVALHDYPAALRDFEHTIQIDARHAYAYLNSGHVYNMLQEYGRAVTRYEHAHELKPQDILIEWAFYWAKTTKNLLDEQDAKKLTAIAALDEQHYQAFLCRSIVHWMKHPEADGVRSALEQIDTLEAEEEDISFWLGMFLALLGRYEEAREKVDKAQEQGLPPLFLRPLYWLETQQGDFFQQYARPLLTYHHL